MNESMRTAVLNLVCWAMMLGASAPSVPAAGVTLDDLAITVAPEHPREFIFTDKGAAHLAGEAVGPDTRSYHGFYIAMHEVVDGWSLRLDDGTVLGANTITSATVTPDRLVRHHRLPDGGEVSETVTLFDDANGFQVVYEGVPAGEFQVLPRVDMRFLWKVGRPAYEVRWQDGVLRVCRKDALDAEPDPAHPRWLAVSVRGADSFTPDGRYLSTDYPKGRARKAMDHANPFLPGAVAGHIPPRVPSGEVQVVFAAAAGEQEAAERAWKLQAEAGTLVAARRTRLQDLIDVRAPATGNPRDDRALAWARVSLDNLIMNQRGPGIYAGFYWFTTYWGRDTFISLPGACIVDGDFATAKTLLRSFAAYQDTAVGSVRLGRVPNFVTVDQVQYAGVDGTWWFVRALDELWKQSGDDEFAREMAPVVMRAIEGALQTAVDDEGFLTHGDGETWMDAGGEQHPYSPRGNRAVEVQALWHRGLLTGARLAGRLLDDPGRAARYRSLADKVAAAFERRFWQDGHLADHLNADGSCDTQIRPNGLLAVLASPALFTTTQRDTITAQCARELVMPWGVRSLAATDPAFHPRHLDLARYYYDEAYHNGDVWLWLSGAYVSALNDPAAGFGQTRMLLDEILDEGAVGTLQEIRDGARAPDNDEFGGATSQAWSLAELLRNVVQDYAGLNVDLTADPPLVRVAPHLPTPWPQLRVPTRIGPVACTLTIRPGRDTAGKVELVFEEQPPSAWVFKLARPDGQGRIGAVEEFDGRWRVVWR